MPINTALNNALGAEILKDSSKLKKQELEKTALKSKIFPKNISENIDLNAQKTDLALQKLVNKLLDEIKSSTQKNQQSINLTNNATSLKIAPNLAKDLKNLSALIEKFAKNEPKFIEFQNKIKEFLKPIESIKSQSLNAQIKNSGIMFEANIKNALSAEILPKSITNLISQMKRVSSNELFKAFVSLGKDEKLSTKESFNHLKMILNETKQKSNEIIQSPQNQVFKQLSTHFAKLENIAKFLTQINAKISQNLPKNSDLDTKIQPNLMTKNDEKIQPNLANKENLNTLKLQNNAEISAKKDNLIHQNKTLLDKNIKTDEKMAQKMQIDENNLPNNKKNVEISNEKPQQYAKNEQILHENIKLDKNVKNDDLAPLKNNSQEKIAKPLAENLANLDKNAQILGQKQENLTQIANFNVKIDAKKIGKKINQIIQNINSNLIKIEPNKNINNQNSNKITNEIEKIKNILKDIENSASILENTAQISQQSRLSENLKTLITKDLNSPNLTLQEKLNIAANKLEQLFKMTNRNFFDAKISLKESKILNKTFHKAYSEISQIVPQNTENLVHNLKDDIKKTLLDINQSTKNSPNPNINQINTATNRLLAQIDIHQLVSFATSSLQTYIPYLWDGMDGGNIAFKQGSKNKYYCKIDLNFKKFGKLNIFLALKDNKFIEITILAQNDDFKNLILKNSKELKSQIFSVGLNITNFNLKNMSQSAKFDAYDTFKTIDIGLDKKA